MEQVLGRVLKKITPTESEQIEIRQVIDKVNSTIMDMISPMNYSFTLAGSFLRDSWLPNKKEFDVFILFPENFTRDRLEKEGLAIGKGIVEKLGGTYRIAYAEHPYTRARVGKFDIDIVPCFAVRSASQIKSAVDRTPFHNHWLSAHFKPEMSSEVRLLKQFLKGQRLYGSDTKTLGFSGYLSELLIVRYGSFRNLLKEASEWQAGSVFIDLGNHHNGNLQDELSKKFKGEPLVMIDPVDPKRNVSSAVSTEKFMGFVIACRGFLKKPSESFFFREAKPMTVVQTRSAAKKRGTVFLGVSFAPPDVIEDILWPQMRRSAKRIVDILEESDFRVMGHGIWTDEKKSAVMFFELEVWMLPAVRKIIGPPVFAAKNAEDFVGKYKSGRAWVEGDNWVAEVQRKFLSAEDKLRAELKAKPKDLQLKGISSHIAESIGKKFVLLDARRMLLLAAKEPGFRECLSDYLSKDMV